VKGGRNPAGRYTVVATRLNAAETEELDAIRGSLSRAEYLRWLFVQARAAAKAQERATNVSP